MQTVHIYAEADSTAPKSAERYAGYVLECMISGRSVTKERFYTKKGTYHQVILSAITEALGRVNQSCEIHIHTQNCFVLNMIEKNLPVWAGNGFMRMKGEPIKNQEQWKKFWMLSQKHLIVNEPGIHTYFNWMQEEMLKMRIAAAPSIY